MATVWTNLATVTRGRNEVYVAAVALKATKGPAQLLVSAADSQYLGFAALYGYNQTLFTFTFSDPENMYTALEVLSSKAIPGTVFVRKLMKPPRSKCWFVGYSTPDTVDTAIKFNKSWETDLRVGQHDCRD